MIFFKKTGYLTLIFTLIALLASLPFKSAKISLSILAGSVTSFANFVILQRFVIGMLDTEKVRPATVIIKIVVKFLILVAIMIAILRLPVDGIALMIGLSTTVVAIVVCGLMKE